MRPRFGFPRGVLAILAVVAVATAAIAQFGAPVAPPNPAASTPGGPVAPVAAAVPAARAPIDWRILENPNGPHTALFFDPVRQVFAVYHVDSGSGQIMLKSIRNLSADLRLDQFNSSNPAPKDIQAMLEEAR